MKTNRTSSSMWVPPYDQEPIATDQAKADFDDDLQINSDFQSDMQGFNPGAEVRWEPLDEIEEDQQM